LLETSIKEIKKEIPTVAKNEHCTLNDFATGIQIISMIKDNLDIMINYTAKLKDEIAFLKHK
jgi:hypothetical protein